MRHTLILHWNWIILRLIYQEEMRIQSPNCINSNFLCECYCTQGIADGASMCISQLHHNSLVHSWTPVEHTKHAAWPSSHVSCTCLTHALHMQAVAFTLHACHMSLYAICICICATCCRVHEPTCMTNVFMLLAQLDENSCTRRLSLCKRVSHRMDQLCRIIEDGKFYFLLKLCKRA